MGPIRWYNRIGVGQSLVRSHRDINRDVETGATRARWSMPHSKLSKYIPYTLSGQFGFSLETLLIHPANVVQTVSLISSPDYKFLPLGHNTLFPASYHFSPFPIIGAPIIALPPRKKPAAAVNFKVRLWFRIHFSLIFSVKSLFPLSRLRDRSRIPFCIHPIR